MKSKNKETEEYKFTKRQLLNAKKYSNRKDLLNAILKDEEKYSFDEADRLIKRFMKGKVN